MGDARSGPRLHAQPDSCMITEQVSLNQTGLQRIGLKLIKRANVMPASIGGMQACLVARRLLLKAVVLAAAHPKVQPVKCSVHC